MDILTLAVAKNSVSSTPGQKGDKGDTGAQGIQGIQGEKGDKGETGDSAYEIAKKNGFVGTEEEWLESLKGEEGVDGITPHIGSNGNWFLGKTDTNCKASVSENEITEKVNTQVNAYLTKYPIVNHYNAANYGVSEDNDDNSPALQALMSKISDDGGGVIYIPNGTYNFKATYTGDSVSYCIFLKPNVSIIGESMHNTVLKINQAEPTTLLYRLYNQDVPLENCTFSDFTVDGSSCTTWKVYAKAFFAQYVKNCIWKNLRLIGTGATALGVDYLYNCTIDSVHCESCGNLWELGRTGSAGIGIGTGGYENENFTITNCICDNCGQFGIFVESQLSLTGHGNLSDSKGYVISNNICRNGKNHGIGVRGGKNIVISNNNTYENANAGIYVDGGDIVSISNNICENNKHGLFVQPSFSSVGTLKMNGNIANSNKECGVLIENQNIKYFDVENVTINNNTILKNAIGIKVANDLKLLDLSNNLVDDSTNGIVIMANIDKVSSNANINYGELINDGIYQNVKYVSDFDAANIKEVTNRVRSVDEVYDLSVFDVSDNEIYKYRFVININDTLYAYASEKPYYLCAYSGKYYICGIPKNGDVFGVRSTQQNGVFSEYAQISMIIELGKTFHRENTLRDLAQIVWCNFNFLDYETEEVVLKAGNYTE